MCSLEMDVFAGNVLVSKSLMLGTYITIVKLNVTCFHYTHLHQMQKDAEACSPRVPTHSTKGGFFADGENRSGRGVWVGKR